MTCETSGKTLDIQADPPPNGAMACETGAPLSFTYDNSGNYNYVIVFAVTHDDVVFLFPGDKNGESVAIQPSGTNVPLPERGTMPPRTRDVMAIFSREPLKAKDVDQHTREVTLAQLPGTEVRMRVSNEIGPL